MPKNKMKPLTEATARRRFHSFADETRNILARLESRGKIDPSDASTLRAFIGNDGRPELLLWSDITALEYASQLLVTEILSLRDKKRSFFFVTFLDDLGHTSDWTPIIRAAAFQTKVKSTLKKLNVEGFAAIEIQPLSNYPQGGQGRLLCVHAHAIVWTDDPFDHLAAERKLNASGAWGNELGADPVRISPIRNKKKHLEGVARYVLKPPHSAKRVIPRKAKPGHNLLVDTTTGYTKSLRLRMFEAFSQIELTSTFFGVGKEGSKLRQSIRGPLEAWHRARPVCQNTVPASLDIWAFWGRLSLMSKKVAYLPFRIDGGAALMRTIKKKRKPRAMGSTLNGPSRPRHSGASSGRSTLPPLAVRNRLNAAKKAHLARVRHSAAKAPKPE